jgi:hypothetical protein
MRFMMEPGRILMLLFCKLRFYRSVLNDIYSGRYPIWHFDKSRLGDCILKKIMRMLLIENGHFCRKLTFFNFLSSVSSSGSFDNRLLPNMNSYRYLSSLTSFGSVLRWLLLTSSSLSNLSSVTIRGTSYRWHLLRFRLNSFSLEKVAGRVIF